MIQPSTSWWSWWSSCPVGCRLSTSSYSGGSSQWSCCHTADCGGCCGSSWQFLWQQSLCPLPALLQFFVFYDRACIQERYFTSESFVFLVLQHHLLQQFQLAGSVLCSSSHQLQAASFLHQLQLLWFHIQDLLIVFSASYFQGVELVFLMQN